MITPKQSMVMRLQHQVCEKVCIDYAKSIATERLRNARRLLLRGQREQSIDFSTNIQAIDWALEGLQKSAKNINSFRGCEGSAYRAYRSGWHKMCRFNFRFDGMKSTGAFLYIHKEVERAMLDKAIEICSEEGLDPYFGLYHGSSTYGFPAMARDLIHAYTPILIDALVLRLINRRQITSKDFEDWDGKPIQGIFHVIEKETQKRLSDSIIYRTNHIDEADRCTYLEALHRQARCVIDLLKGGEFKIFILK